MVGMGLEDEDTGKEIREGRVTRGRAQHGQKHGGRK